MKKLSKLFEAWLGHCRFEHTCPEYTTSSATCLKNGGSYCGKFRELSANESTGGIKIHA